MAVKKLCILILLVLCINQATAGCANYHNGSICHESVPCCSGGYCNPLGHRCIANICDPSNSYSPNSCYPKPQCESFSDDFSKNDLIEFGVFNGNPNGDYHWYSNYTPSYAAIKNQELVLSMKLGNKTNKEHDREGFGATVSSIRWIQYGTVTAKVKTASVAPGVVTSFIIRSPEGDEIDFEWVGKSPNEVQTNYYYHEDLHDNRHSMSVSVNDNTARSFNEYQIQWEEESIKWYVNSKLARTLLRKNTTYDEKTKEHRYPSQLAQVQFGIWDSNSGGNGTMSWAGGPTNWSNPNTVFEAYFDDIKIECKHNGNQIQNFPIATVVTTTSTSTSFTSTSTVANASTTKSSLGQAADVRHKLVENSATSIQCCFTLLSLVYLLSNYMLNL
ncbi:putative glycosidase CRH2 [Basidiobolus ranarum]|uniref:Glycosidase CRH2 n=1 Tax=Basidiobolus ranarum TaxID=34480 RepID=A0ABR2VVB0_9FUNG